jgi:hypothetical protein
MNIIEIINKRKSCRTFNQIYLKPADSEFLENIIRANSKGFENEVVDFRIIEKHDSKSLLKLDYGMIHGHNTYLLGTSKSSLYSRVNYGYLMEKIILKATEMKISTCWIGIFDHTYFKEVPVKEGYEIPGIVIIGYPGDQQTNQERFIRRSLSSATRDNWDKLFFSYNSKFPINQDLPREFYDSLEMVRLAPSSGNTQPWRIYFDNTSNEFHFFKKTINKRYESRGLHDIDLGIALCHFELTSFRNGISGRWLKLENEYVSSIDDLQYIKTWKCE